MKTYIVTGGAGSLGSVVVKALMTRGDKVRVVDDMSRGNTDRFKGMDVDLCQASISYPSMIPWPFQYPADCVIHMAAINGTKNFYERPDVVLDTSIRGMIHVLNWCRDFHIPELLFVSSSEVYQNAPIIPTPEDIPLIVPDLSNPRYSYGGGKIAAELLAVHCGKFLKRMMIVRPHNCYSGDMAPDHVIPSLIEKILNPVLWAHNKATSNAIPIQGTGQETRSFCYIDDFVSGLLTVLDKGENRQVYNIGTQDEISIADLVSKVGAVCGIVAHPILSQPLQKGSPSRRCPDNTKLRELGWEPKISLEEGLKKTVQWYRENTNEIQGESQATAETK